MYNKNYNANELINIINTSDSYPYKRYYMTLKEIRERFNRLIDYEPHIIKLDHHNVFNLNKMEQNLLKYNGEYICFKVFKENYDKYDNISDYFTEKVRVRCRRKDNISSYDFWQKNYKKIIKMTKYPICAASLRETIYNLHYECNTFKPSLMVGFIKYFMKLIPFNVNNSNSENNIKKMHILDISAGWGDRLIAACALNMHYTGCDPNAELLEGYNEIIETFLNKTDKEQTKITLKMEGFETAKLEDTYNFVFSSPPYFNLEIYSDNEKQSIYNKNLNQWYDSFLITSLKKAAKHLNGFMIININNIKGENDFVEKMVLEDIGAKYEGCITQMSEPTDNINKSAQPFFIWSKFKN